MQQNSTCVIVYSNLKKDIGFNFVQCRSYVSCFSLLKSLKLIWLKLFHAEIDRQKDRTNLYAINGNYSGTGRWSATKVDRIPIYVSPPLKIHS